MSRNTIGYIFYKNTCFDLAQRDVPVFVNEENFNTYLNKHLITSYEQDPTDSAQKNANALAFNPLQRELYVSFDAAGTDDIMTNNLLQANYMKVYVHPYAGNENPEYRNYYYFVKRVTPIMSPYEVEGKKRATYRLEIEIDLFQTFYFKNGAVNSWHYRNRITKCTDNLSEWGRSDKLPNFRPIPAPFMTPAIPAPTKKGQAVKYIGSEKSVVDPCIFCQLQGKDGTPSQLGVLWGGDWTANNSFNMKLNDISRLFILTADVTIANSPDTIQLPEATYTCYPQDAFVIPRGMAPGRTTGGAVAVIGTGAAAPKVRFSRSIDIARSKEVPQLDKGLQESGTVRVYAAGIWTGDDIRKIAEAKVGTVNNNIAINFWDKINGDDIATTQNIIINYNSTITNSALNIKISYGDNEVDITPDLRIPIFVSQAAQAQSGDRTVYELRQLGSILSGTMQIGRGAAGAIAGGDIAGGVISGIEGAANIGLNLATLEAERNAALNREAITRGGDNGGVAIPYFLGVDNMFKDYSHAIGVIYAPLTATGAAEFWKNMSLYGYTCDVYVGTYRLPQTLRSGKFITTSGMSCAFIEMAETTVVGEFGADIANYFAKIFARGVRFWYNIDDWEDGNVQTRENG